MSSRLFTRNLFAEVHQGDMMDFSSGMSQVSVLNGHPMGDEAGMLYDTAGFRSSGDCV
jgi:hypothetical protein